ncbi:MAG: D-tyrosyl-tRNA(Tyr) deacylase [Candidatus Tectomicrobia bacterium]|uniref:D-aminoacyl-tRNA deacylase n=1 Tax=Tectimicrobiota bacterium TaxID=2528274 RepID=A0A938B224_UNCTE|nr:D-tyrosyl-tRNA(Tyr) deacylase [Candidatus Tectomicrobia bacterium]
MRALIQRVAQAEVRVAEAIVGQIERGLLVLLGVHEHDTLQAAESLASKIVTLRIFEDAQGKMNRDVQEIGGAVLVVSQFTLYADTRKGRRPAFTQAARPPLAEQLYEAFMVAVGRHGVPVAHGVFGAHMAVSLVNDGPVTIWLESPPPVKEREVP